MRNLAVATGVVFALAASMTACATESEAPAATETGPADLRVWFMKDSVPPSAQELLKTQFEKENTGSTLTVEEQAWKGIVQKLQTSLPSESQTPDLVETGNTQTSVFASVGAFSDITDQVDELGGDSLIQSFIDSASWDGQIYGVPLSAGSRGVYYRTDLFEKAGIEVPKTLDDLHEAIDTLQAANPDQVADFSAIYLAASDVHAPESWLFANGGDYASEKDGTWTGELSSPESQQALGELQNIWASRTKYGLDSISAANGMYNLFNEGRVGMMVGTGNVAKQIAPELLDSGKVGMFAFPGLDADEAGATFAGGSNISISAASKNQALSQSALEIIMGKDFQSLLASDGGWVPGNLNYADALTGPFAEAAREAVTTSKLTPNTPAWGVATGNNVIQNFYTRIAQGDDPAAVAKEVDAALEETLNAGN
ncbi:extracellular solute-binding protein [Cryobacterium sp. N19]|uniref:extracellular solute-binding protein n=1 Tax=Cryobacterium sp. N19 TaxID=2048288 RepID=UPI000CE3AF95|nr:extracellular solute-binding protein [Cryobacterium sp. N19]